MIKDLIFDVDGTLWDSTPIVAKGWNQAVKETGYSAAVITPAILRREFGQPMDVIAEHVFADVTDKEKRRELMDRCCVHEQRLLEETAEDITYPGVCAEMEKLAARYRLFIVSNCQCGYIELVIRKNGFSGLIRDFECFGNTGTGKGETMRTLMERNKIKPEEAVYIGDTRGDQEAAAYAGVSFFFAAYGFGSVENAEYRIGSFAELMPTLEKISGAASSGTVC